MLQSVLRIPCNQYALSDASVSFCRKCSCQILCLLHAECVPCRLNSTVLFLTHLASSDSSLQDYGKKYDGKDYDEKVKSVQEALLLLNQLNCSSILSHTLPCGVAAAPKDVPCTDKQVATVQ